MIKVSKFTAEQLESLDKARLISYHFFPYGETETNPNDYLGVFYAKTSIKDRLDFKSSLH